MIVPTVELPNNNSQTLRVNLKEASTLKITLFDVEGRLVKEVFDGKAANGINDFSINVSTLASSLYFYRIQTNSFARTIKFNKL